MMNNEDYLKKIVIRGNELAVLDQAAENLCKEHPLIRLVLAVAAGCATLLMPAVSAAQMLLM